MRDRQVFRACPCSSFTPFTFTSPVLLSHTLTMSECEVIKACFELHFVQAAEIYASSLSAAQYSLQNCWLHSVCVCVCQRLWTYCKRHTAVWLNGSCGWTVCLSCTVWGDWGPREMFILLRRWQNRGFPFRFNGHVRLCRRDTVI